MTETTDEPGGGSAVYEADPYEYGDARQLMEKLDLAEPVAITLVRRGHRTVDDARAFLAADERHDGSGFRGIDEVVETIQLAVDAGSRITVHGDYDVDGISATAILVGALRRAGAECDWLIPDRATDGYGLSTATVDRLAERGTELVITADCGIASPQEVEYASGLGMEVIVTDHHKPGEQLPACLIVHPEVSGYPFAGLCGAAVAHKVVEQFELALGVPPAEAAAGDLDLVALATVADLVPLVDENRTLTRLGLAELRRARRPGIRALLAVSRVEAEHLDEGDIAFRIAPRLNAAGRLYRADAGVELMLCDDDARADEIAAELDAANHQRRDVEREVSNSAATAYRELPDELRDAAGLVLAGDGWHPGVVGITASRMVERHGRPVIVLSVAEGRAKGSGRSVPGFDLLAALQECDEHLDKFGGHRAAAGMELSADRIDDFRQAFAAAAASQFPDGPAPQPERIDAVVGAEALNTQFAEQLNSLGPFGMGNPGVRLLVPWTQVGDVRPMGEGGRHARFSLSNGRGKAAGVAFNSAKKLDAAQGAPTDLTVRLELNHWNGAVEPRAVLEATRAGEQGDSPPAQRCACGDAEGPDERWWELFEAGLSEDPAADPWPEPPADARRLVLRQADRSPVALIGELLSSGSRVLALSADARRRAKLATLAASPSRFGGSQAVVCGACPDGAVDAAAEVDGAQLLLSDWDRLATSPGLPENFTHVVCVDPPPTARVREIAGSGDGYLHQAWSGAGELPVAAWGERWQPRSALAEIYRGLASESLASEALGDLLCAQGGMRRAPSVAARCVRVLCELGIAELEGDPGARGLRVVSSEKTELERSEAWRAFAARHEEGLEYLQSQTVS